MNKQVFTPRVYCNVVIQVCLAVKTPYGFHACPTILSKKLQTVADARQISQKLYENLTLQA